MLAFASMSLKASNDKFKGPGKIQKHQYNVAFDQDLGSLGFDHPGGPLQFQNRNNNIYAAQFPSILTRPIRPIPLVAGASCFRRAERGA